MHQVADGVSTSLRGQGLTANWRDLRVRSVTEFGQHLVTTGQESVDEN
ncbi:hypothetical protein [Streptomyces sp. DSM 40750]